MLVIQQAARVRKECRNTLGSAQYARQLLQHLCKNCHLVPLRGSQRAHLRPSVHNSRQPGKRPYPAVRPGSCVSALKRRRRYSEVPLSRARTSPSRKHPQDWSRENPCSYPKFRLVSQVESIGFCVPKWYRRPQKKRGHFLCLLLPQFCRRFSTNGGHLPVQGKT